jgi:pyridoxine 5-phosphate synthase
VELYTESFAHEFAKGNKENGIAPFVRAAEMAHKVGLGLNAGHDLNLQNIAYFHQHIPNLLEVSIGHALICESLYFGLENVVNQYRTKLT